jgi:Omp85 superfamily domain/Surface antigen variable number repeat
MCAALLVALTFVSGTAAQETIAAIQVHGNTATSDEEIRRLAGIDIGTLLDQTTLAEVEQRLRATKQFEHVQVLKRFASIADPSQILIVIVVDEGAVRIERTNDPDRPMRVVRNRRLDLMFLPILRYEDGFGVTYGVRLARVGVAGSRSRVAFPLTWGGEKKAEVEFDKTVPRGPIDRILAGGAISRRTNPFYEQDDDRRAVWLRGERELVSKLRAGAAGGWQRASFVDLEDRVTHAGVDVVLDTRANPALPRNAVYAKAALEYVSLDPLQRGLPSSRTEAAPDVPDERSQDLGSRNAGGGLTRTEMDVRGYAGLAGQSVVALRVLRHDSNRPLPPYLKPLLGGMSNLRGFAAGTAAGDSLVAASAELILPLTSPLQVGKMGVSVFVDVGTAYDNGSRLADQKLKRGEGGSVWFSAAFLQLNIAVAHGRGSSTRVHVGGTLLF